MKGKIFSESANLEQDQARLLFEYYQQMAEKIVAEEERIEGETSQLEQQQRETTAALEHARMMKLVMAGLGVLVVIIGLVADMIPLAVIGGLFAIPFIVFLMKEQEQAKKIASLSARIAEFQQQHKDIFRDYRVTKLGVAYVPVAEQIKYEDKSFIIDYTGAVRNAEIRLEVPRQNDLLAETIATLEQMPREVPVIDSSREVETVATDDYSRSMQQLNQHDYFGRLERSLRTVSFCLDDMEISSASLPLVENDGDYLAFLKEFAADGDTGGAPVFEVFDVEKYRADIERFRELNRLKDSLARHTRQFEDVLKDLMRTMSRSVQNISARKLASAGKVIGDSNKILFQILKAPYNHYSPVLEAEEIERIKNEDFDYGESAQGYQPFNLRASSRVRYNLYTGTWDAGDGSTTNFPFGIHQIQEEIVMPVVQNLMRETRQERLKIYTRIKEQKTYYLNQWHKDTEDFYGRNRAESADLVNLMREGLKNFIAKSNALAALEKTEKQMAESQSLDSAVVSKTADAVVTVSAYELQTKDIQKTQEEFEDYMLRLKDDIDAKHRSFQHTEYYDASLRDKNSHDTALAAGEIHTLSERRKPLTMVNPLFAKKSELPPEPLVENITHEHLSLNLPAIAKNALKELEETPTPLTVTETPSPSATPTDVPSPTAAAPEATPPSATAETTLAKEPTPPPAPPTAAEPSSASASPSASAPVAEVAPPTPLPSKLPPPRSPSAPLSAGAKTTQLIVAPPAAVSAEYAKKFAQLRKQMDETKRESAELEEAKRQAAAEKPSDSFADDADDDSAADGDAVDGEDFADADVDGDVDHDEENI